MNDTPGPLRRAVVYSLLIGLSASLLLLLLSLTMAFLCAIRKQTQATCKEV